MKRFYRNHKKLCISSVIGILFVGAAGSLLHFVYDWSGQNFLVGLFTPVNESTWEHMKLCYFPLVVFFLAEYGFLYRSYSHLLRADFAGIITGTLLIPVIFYTYTGVIGTHNLFLDILTFLISAAAGICIRLRLLLSNGKKALSRSTTAAPSERHALRGALGYTFLLFTCVLVLGICFLIFTYYPPDIALFAEP